LGEGVVYEALNMASLWSAPVLYVVEDNGIAQTTPRSLAFSGGIGERFNAFAVPATEIVSSDAEEIAGISRGLLHEVREQSEPRALVIGTHRFAPHSKGDDTRPAGEIAAMRATSDPLAILGPRVTDEERSAIEARVEIEVAEAFETALADPVAVMESIPA
jgi:TPP-dependent pyruvate/acetoin dehydrogenase alpha subunit